MPPTNGATEFLNSNKPTTKELIPLFKKKDATFWHFVFSDTAISISITKYGVLKDMPPQAEQQLRTLFAELIRSGEEEGPECILSDEYQDAYREASNDEPSL